MGWASKPGVSGQRLTLPAELEDGHIPARVGSLANYVCLLIFLAILWGSFAQLRELVLAQGQIVPSGRIKQIEHLEGGKVEQVFVGEGQIVGTGTPLIALRPTAAKSDLNQLRVRAAGLELKLRALSALLDGKEPDFGALGERYAALSDEQLRGFKTKLAHMAEERRVLASRAAQKDADVEALSQEVKSLERQIAIEREQLGIREKSLKLGYTSRRQYLTTKALLEELVGKHAATAGRLAVSKEQLVESRSLLKASDAEARNALSEDHSKTATELAELQEQIAKHRDRVERLIVRSPIHGIVQELSQKAAGEVVRPGDLVAKVVPLDKDVVAEVRIDPKDIGHIRKGDPAEIKLSTFDPSIFGIAKGKIDVISASTFATEEGEFYYKAVVKLDENHIGQGHARRMILPGMVVEANIVTGSKSLIKYLLKPVYRSLDTAFTER